MLRYRTPILATLLAAALLAAGPALAAGARRSAAGWTVVPIPPSGQNAFVIGLAADSGTDAWAVGTVNRTGGAAPGPLIDHWNGTAWHVAAAPAYPASDLVNLDAVSTSGGADAWAGGFTETGGGGGQPFPTAAHWNGTAWAIVPPASITIGGQPVSNYLVGLADLGPADAWAVDDCTPEATGFVEHWDGKAWSVVPVPDPNPVHPGMTQSLSAISADSAHDVWAVGDYLIRTGPASDRYETYTLHWNGTSWRVVHMPKVAGTNDLEAYQFNAIDAISPDNVWAVGDAGINVTTIGTPSRTLIEHWNGTAWSIVPSPKGGTAPFLDGVAAVGPASIWAVGSDTPAGGQPQTLALHWNGTAWTRAPSPTVGGASRLVTASAIPGGSGIWAAGYSGTSGSFNPLALRTTG